MQWPLFEIGIEPEARLRRITLRGFWSTSTLADYEDALCQEVARLIAAGCPLAEMLVYVDARDLDTQAQPLIAEYQRRFGGPGRQPRRIAMVMSQALPKLQAQRVAFENQRVFDDPDEAVAWLASEP